MNYKIVTAMLHFCILLCLTGCIQPISNTGMVAQDPTATANATDFAGMDVQNWVDVSPNQTWTATGMVATPPNGGEQYYTELHVTNAAGTLVWTPIADWRNFGLGYTTPRIVHWSADGRYLYFTNAPHPDGCALFTNASDLQQLDLGAGTVTEILPPDRISVLAAAPDGTMAYITQTMLGLLDPLSKTIKETTYDFAAATVQVGDLTWSSNGQQLAYVVATDPCLPPTWRHAIYTVDRQGGNLRLVLPADERRLRIVDWIDESHLLLMDLDAKQSVLDLASGQVREPQSLQSPTVQRAIVAAQRFVAQTGGDSTLPVVFAGVELITYRAGRIIRLTSTQQMFAVYADTSAILQYGPNGNADLVGQIDTALPRKTLAELEAQAQALVAAQNLGIDLDQLAAQHSNKDARVYFFRWDDRSNQVNGMPAFIQVALSAAGELVSYTNTIALVVPNK